ncbi:acyltransferase family protein [Microcella sp.]|uniref:acyltransferase family protein n=1 Tax=Microcella sp. TaxID=1913979 RepID=UPI003F72A4A4
MSPLAEPGRAIAGEGVRPEIQALRAFAVVAVLLYHLWPLRLTGGFIGVDVFFVVSGFLITAHLVRELASTGTIRLGRFWARRARRLLPASFLVLAFAAAATLAFVPQGRWQQFFREIGASALYIENWALAADAVDYLAAENVTSPVQHYWSLGVEEQLYLIWPLLLIGVAVAFRRRRSALGAGVLAVISIALVASLAYSSALVAVGSPTAYFVTPGRVWEFAAGGLLALAGTQFHRIRPEIAAALAWAGWIGLMATAVLFDGSTPFPGYGALPPVVFTLLILAAGSPSMRWSPAGLTRLRPVQWLGDVSYSTYLWHWPLIVLIPFANDRDLTTVDKLGILIVSLALAALTTRFIENPFRFAPWSTRVSPQGVLAGALALSLVLVGGSAVAWTAVQRWNDEAIAQAAEWEVRLAECFGASYLADPGCTDVELPPGFIPTVATAVDDRPIISSSECRAETTDPVVKSCTFGAPGGTRVALIGDSHAASWFPALEALAEEHGWELTTYYKGACGFNVADRLGSNPEQVSSCLEWNERLGEELRSVDAFEVVFTVTSAMADFIDDGGEQTPRAAIEGFHGAWQPLRDAGTRIVPIRDLPLLTEAGEACQLENAIDPTLCMQTRERALSLPDYAMDAASEWEIPTIDMTDYFCDSRECATVAGGVLVYSDSHHFTATWARSLTPLLERELQKIGVLD